MGSIVLGSVALGLWKLFFALPFQAAGEGRKGLARMSNE
jgi:hypothetical protein